MLIPAGAAHAQINLNGNRVTVSGDVYKFSQSFDAPPLPNPPPKNAGTQPDPNGQYLTVYGQNGQGGNSTQNWANNSTLVGWYGDAVNGQITVTNGGSNNAGLANFGSIGSSDRALGLLNQGNVTQSAVALRIVNNTGSAIDSFTVRFKGEQWKSSGKGNTSLTFDFAVFGPNVMGSHVFGTTGYKSNAQTSQLSFTSPQGLTASGALDGNLAVNSQDLTATINLKGTSNSDGTTNTSLMPNQELWLRWTNTNSGGNDNGLALDGLSLDFFAVSIPEPGTLTLVPLAVLALAGTGVARRRRGAG